MINKRFRVLLACLLLFVGTSKSFGMSRTQSNISGGNSESAVSKSNGIFTYETGSIVSRTAGVFSAFGSVVGLGFALVGITDIFDGVKTGGFNPFNVELVFAVGGGLVFIACAGMSYGFFKLAKYFDSKLES